MSLAFVDGGFAEPVFGSQRAFRALMDAFARPGTVADLSGLAVPPAPISPAAGAILLALADADTPVFFETDMPDVKAWTGFHTGAAATADALSARFVLLSDDSDCAGWRRFAVGTAEYPDRSATLLLPVAELRGGQRLTLRGPGIETTTDIAPQGLGAGFLDVMAANRAGFPLGFDLVLVSGGEALALPRTTRIQEA
ncbi:phosphonate C-P lyase system protein PhnH [Rhizobium sp. 9140]|uniref:phosphonate C-P lyase system protein PhnH n=1 Tax=Rhizobium sp. 9140 TaxID=1761900 RepID=UPI0007928CBE|nr:phosphonate C-P lyase system protein PhnH [Rhizobium sp. 9140]CZT33838.1 alpha-D-ribose 1-methylphosphonate 5-triphosphate synthase subunit PhnH [Rhizobium sp. 9140]